MILQRAGAGKLMRARARFLLLLPWCDSINANIFAACAGYSGAAGVARLLLFFCGGARARILCFVTMIPIMMTAHVNAGMQTIVIPRDYSFWRIIYSIVLNLLGYYACGGVPRRNGDMAQILVVVMTMAWLYCCVVYGIAAWRHGVLRVRARGARWTAAANLMIFTIVDDLAARVLRAFA